AFSAYYFTQKYIKEITNITLTSPSRAVEAAKLICNMTMAEVLLTNGYHFDETSYPSISFREKSLLSSLRTCLHEYNDELNGALVSSGALRNKRNLCFASVSDGLFSSYHKGSYVCQWKALLYGAVYRER
ncbi:hypothetical protein GOODEAATRI_032793, partial [Goodea atripinnis]